MDQEGQVDQGGNKMTKVVFILVLMLVVNACLDRPISVRDGSADVNPASDDTCNPQSPPSPQCPAKEEKKEEDDSDKSNSNPESAGSGHEVGVAEMPVPVYTDGKMELEITPYPHTLIADKEDELVLTFTAVTAMEGTEGREMIISLDHKAVSEDVSIRSSTCGHLKARLYCLEQMSPRRCKIHLWKMEKDDKCEFTLTVTASADFDLAVGLKAGQGSFRKKPDSRLPDIPDATPPKITVE